MIYPGEYYIVQLLFFGLGFYFFRYSSNTTWMAQTEKRWKGWAAFIIMVCCAIMVFCFIYLLFGSIPHSEGLSPWPGIGLVVAAIALHCSNFGFLCSVVASEKNRNPVRYILLGALLGIIGLMAAISIPKLEENKVLIQ